jgi:hypothetical protein
LDLELVHYQQQGARSYNKQQGARSKKQEGKKKIQAARDKNQEEKKEKKKLEGCNSDLN